MIKQNILLVVADETNKMKYDCYLKGGFPFDLVSGLNTAYQECLKTYYDLILVDLKLSLGQQGRMYLDKLNSLSHSPPVLKIRPNRDQVEVILLEQRTVEELNTFLQKFFDKMKEEESVSTNARKYERYKSILRVILEPDSSGGSVRANTLNISRGGLFITTPLPFELNRTLDIHMYDAAPDPIRSTIRIVWLRPWDVPHQLPGLGAQFLSFDRETDQDALIDYLRNVQNQTREAFSKPGL